MCKNDLCGRIIALVSEVAEVEASDIMSGNRRPDVVDARDLAIFLMLVKGVQIYRVALFMGLTERNVYHVKERFEDRMRYGDPMIENYYKAVLAALKQV